MHISGAHTFTAYFIKLIFYRIFLVFFLLKYLSYFELLCELCVQNVTIEMAVHEY